MIQAVRPGVAIIIAIASVGGAGCALRRPSTVSARMIEPQLVEPPKKEDSAASTTTIRLLDTQARGHIGRRVLHQQPNGELTEDPVWRWSSAPDRYLDTALRLELGSNPVYRLVDAAAPALAATLLVWDLESAGGETRLVAAVEFQFTGTDRVVHTQVVRGSEPVSGELPGNLAAAAGKLLRRLSTEGLARMVGER